jgi:hypothetical protein
MSAFSVIKYRPGDQMPPVPGHKCVSVSHDFPNHMNPLGRSAGNSSCTDGCLEPAMWILRLVSIVPDGVALMSFKPDFNLGAWQL